MAQNEEYTFIFPSDVSRIKGLSDAIFAFAMTLLIILGSLPNILPSAAASELPRLLEQQWRHYLIYIVSFLNIANYWTAHYLLFGNIIRANRVLISLNFLLLLSVTFVPFPAALMSRYGRLPIIAVLYGVTLTSSYFLLMLIARYAYMDNRLTRPELKLPVKRIIHFRMILPLAFAVIGTCLAYYFPRLGFLIYLIVSLSAMTPIKWFVKGIHIIPQDKPD